MGSSESSIFKKCKIDEQPVYSCKQWSLYDCSNGKHQLSLFVCNVNHNIDHFDITYWKKIRHPYIVKYYDCGVLRGKQCVVTERVEPLRMVMDKMSRDVMISGLFNITEATSFLHDTCGNSHNNVTMDSLFVSKSESLCWKLGSLLFVSHVSQETDHFLSNLSKFHTHHGTNSLLPPEDVVHDKMEKISQQNQVHRRDCYAFGLILCQLLNDVKLSETMKSLRSESVSLRPTMKSLLTDDLFAKCDFLQIKSSLTNFASLNECDKQSFIDTLVDRLRHLSPQLVASHIIPIMLTSRVIISNTEFMHKVIPFLLIPLNSPDEQIELKQNTSGGTITVTVHPIISKSLFKSQLIPFICKLFYVRDVQLRLILLQYLPYYLPLISTNCFTNLFLPQILFGLKDDHDNIVSETLVGLSHCVSQFGALTVFGPRFKLFHTGIPKSVEESSEHFVESESSSLILEEEAMKSIKMNDLMPERSSPDGRELDTIEVICDKDDDQIGKNKKSKNVIKKEITTLRLQTTEEASSSKPNATTPNHHENHVKPTPSSSSSVSRNRSSELDIKALDFKLETEIDFFTDMEPVLKFKQPENLGLSELGLQTKIELKNSSSSSLLFAVNEASLGEVMNSGWGEEEEWEEELVREKE